MTRYRRSDIGPFVIVPRWVRQACLRDRPQAGASALVVYQVLAEYADRETGDCWPSMATIAEECCVSEVSVRASLTLLKEVGAISSQARIDPETGRQMSNLYTVHTSRPEPGEGEAGLTHGGVRQVQGEGEAGLTQTRTIEQEPLEPEKTPPAEKTAGDEEHSHALEQVLALTPAQVTDRIVKDFYEHCKRRNGGRAPRAWKVPQMKKLVQPFVDEGWPPIEVARALGTLEDSGQAFCLQSIERTLKGKGRSPAAARAASTLQQMAERVQGWDS